MKLKYESEILFDLMKRDGDDAPSDVLPYESELKEKYLNQVVGAYPKLQDYRPEWLTYNLYHHLPSDFPTESVTNVTSASFHDVVPYAYKSAILKGNTLVNSWKKHNTYAPGNFTFHDDGFMELNNPTLYFDHVQTDSSLLKPNTKYLLIIEAKNNTLPVETYFHPDSRSVFSGVEKTVLFAPKENGVRKAILTSNSDFSTTANDLRWGVYISFTQANMSENERGTISVRQMLLEYQDGMENWDIPYFEGMQSVKMPVLTTTGKNLFGGILTSGQLLDNNVTNNNQTKMGCSEFSPVEEKTDICCSYYTNSNYKIEKIFFYDENKTQIGSVTTPRKVTTPKGTKYFRFSITTTNWSSSVVFNDIKDDFKIQVETGTQTTPYEPYKSNILTANEEVELRGIGDIQDTLDLISGEIIESVGEGVLNGSENWVLNTSKEQPNHWCFSNNQSLTGKKLLISDKFPQSDIDGDRESIRGGGDYIFVYISKEKVDGNTNSFTQWLSQNPIKYQYTKSEESIKTVDLTCINEQGENETPRPFEGTMHVNTSSQTLTPLLDMSVPVEATSQNLMSFANIVEEEK